jgi:methylmalonyl-CoA mutase C-terminal domain/subunit
VDVIGLSILSGAHIPFTEKLMEKLKDAGLDHKIVLVGGNIPKGDIAALKALGVASVFPTGSNFDDIAKFIRQSIEADESRL